MALTRIRLPLHCLRFLLLPGSLRLRSLHICLGRRSAGLFLANGGRSERLWMYTRDRTSTETGCPKFDNELTGSSAYSSSSSSLSSLGSAWSSSSSSASCFLLRVDIVEETRWDGLENKIRVPRTDATNCDSKICRRFEVGKKGENGRRNGRE